MPGAGGEEPPLGARAQVIAASGVAVEIVDVGGGFPVAYPGSEPPALAGFIAAIREGAALLPPGTRLWAEPGRALVAGGASVVVQVQQRRGDALYVNDGVYGALSDAGAPGFRFPHRLLRPDGTASEVCGTSRCSADLRQRRRDARPLDPARRCAGGATGSRSASSAPMARRCARRSTASTARWSRKCPDAPRCSRPPDMAARRPSAPPDARNAPTMKHAAFDGRLVMLGFGSIGQGVLPLILRHIDMPRERIEIVTADDRGAAIAAGHGVAHTVRPLTRENHAAVLRGKLSKGDLLLNLSVDVSSVALVALCREIGALYLDTCVEPGPAAIPTPRSPSRSGPTMRCGKGALARSGAPAPPR